MQEQDIDTVEQTIMTKDEWLTRGLLFACRAEEETELEEQEKWLEKSLGPFTQSGSDIMRTRVQQHLKSLRIRRNLAQLETGSGLSVATEAEIAGLIMALVESGLAAEAGRLCSDFIRVMDDDEEAQKQLISEQLLNCLPKHNL